MFNKSSSQSKIMNAFKFKMLLRMTTCHKGNCIGFSFSQSTQQPSISHNIWLVPNRGIFVDVTATMQRFKSERWAELLVKVDEIGIQGVFSCTPKMTLGTSLSTNSCHFTQIFINNLVLKTIEYLIKL